MKTLSVIVIAFWLVVPTYAQYGGGTGEANDPYLIYTAEQMNEVGLHEEDWDKQFKLMTDIDLLDFDGKDERPAFKVIGTSFDNAFTGVFNGNGCMVSHFTYASVDANNVGLFGYVKGENATVKNLKLIDPHITGRSHVGSLVGYLEKGVVDGCRVKGGRISGQWDVGGLVGSNSGTITRCCSTARVIGKNGVAGLVGANYGGIISDCLAKGDVSGDRFIGGLVGDNPSFSGSSRAIVGCYSSGNVWGDEYLGGLVGSSGWSYPGASLTVLLNCYSTSDVAGDDYVGGLVGSNEDVGTITNCYTIGGVTGTTNVGGLVGANSGVIQASFWNNETSGQWTSDGGIGKSTTEMQAASTFLEAGWDFMGDTENGPEDVWWILEGRDYPKLWWQYGQAISPYPRDGASEVFQPIILSWATEGTPLQHDVYFGLDRDAVTNATTESSHIYRGRQLAEVRAYNPGPLEWNQMYYWRIDEVNEVDPCSPWKGEVWSFTTANFLVVDDFESYDDDDENPIWNTWMDGWVNGTGSCLAFLLPPWVGIDPPTHSGMYSMPFGYNNADLPYYSEAYRTWEVPQDWTMGGCSHLSLWVRGEPVSLWEKPDQTVVMSGYGSEREDARAYGFVHKSLNGDGEIVARIDSLNKAEDWVRAGVMIRANLEQDSPYAATTITGAYGICFIHCMGGKNEGIPTTNTGPQVPHSVKLTRHGDTFTAQHSVDGVNWQDVTDVEGKPITVTVPMPQIVYVGLCVSGTGWEPWGHGAATAMFSNITIIGHVTGTWEVAEQGYWYNPTNSLDNLYVALQDSAGRTGTVIHPDPMAVIVTEWRHWKILLSAFTSTGVDPMAIKRIYIGVGDRDNPQPNGTGWIHIDDICLTNQMP